ncbi:MAG: septum formation initiator family protein [Deltaproteobacteria bacterium]|nr:MAG: septum formation initiator family protein [Deltaproteobacteria bacterium]
MGDEPVKKREWRFPAWWFVPVALLLGFAVFGDNGVVDMLRRHQQKQQLQAQVNQLQRENEQLRREIKALKSDWRTIEAIARQKLGMVRPDEVVYQFPARDKAGEKPPTDAGRATAK